MPRRRNSESERARQVLAQEAARIIVDHGIRDYRVAKQKAAERLGIGSRGALPGNAEIEAAVAEYLQLFGGESHSDLLRLMRTAALSAMELPDAPLLASGSNNRPPIIVHHPGGVGEILHDADGGSWLKGSIQPFEEAANPPSDTQFVAIA